MSRAYDNAADGRYQQGGRRNLIINGAMEVAQRGTSFTASGYTLDRFNLNLSGATATVTQETFTVGQTDVPSQFRKYLRLATSAGNDNCGIIHRIEDVDSIEGTVLLSFYAKGTNPGGGNFSIKVNQIFGSGGSSNVLGSEISFTVTSSWQRFEQVITLPSLAGKTIGTSSYIEIQLIQPGTDASTDAWTLDITGVQVEEGNIATPFEHRSYGEELALCQRYYQKSFAQGVTPQDGQYTVNVTTAWESSTNARGNWIPFPVEMRATPTFTQYGNSSNWQIFTGSSWQTTTNSNVGASVKSYGFYPTLVGGVTNSSLHPWYGKGDYTVDAEL